jgi:hypothetical protein
MPFGKHRVSQMAAEKARNPRNEHLHRSPFSCFTQKFTLNPEAWLLPEKSLPFRADARKESTFPVLRRFSAARETAAYESTRCKKTFVSGP